MSTIESNVSNDEKINKFLKDAGSEFKKARLDSLLSLRQAAAILDVSPPTYKNLEDGAGTVEIKTFLRCANHFSRAGSLRNILLNSFDKNVL